jgi:hypothetical protein
MEKMMSTTTNNAEVCELTTDQLDLVNGGWPVGPGPYLAAWHNCIEFARSAMVYDSIGWCADHHGVPY